MFHCLKSSIAACVARNLEINANLDLYLVKHIRIVLDDSNVQIVQGIRHHLQNNVIGLSLCVFSTFYGSKTTVFICLIAALVDWNRKNELRATKGVGLFVDKASLVRLGHIISSIKAYTHSALRGIAVHEWLEHLLAAVFIDTRARILDNKFQKSFIILQPYHDCSALRGVLYGITYKIIGNNINKMTVEIHREFLIEGCKR